MPKSNHGENAQEFEERLAAAKTCPTIIFPRGAHESNSHWRSRLQAQAKSKRPIMPKSEAEPEQGFAERCLMQARCESVVHPYDPKRETEVVYYRRLEACKDKTALGFEPGDTKAIDSAIGPPPKVEHKPAEHHEYEHVEAAADMKKALEEAEKTKSLEAASAKMADDEYEKEKAAEKEKEEEEARVAQRLAEMKVKQEEERAKKEAEEEEAKKSFGLEKIAINKIGFMPLKKLLQERGVPKEEISSAANKFALMEVAKKHAEALKIEWVEEAVDVS